MLFQSTVFFLLTCAFAAPHPRANMNNGTAEYNNLTVAIVRAEPAYWPMPLMNKNWTGHAFNLNATVAKAVALIGEAAENGANLVVFPELWFPGYPKGMADNVTMRPWLESYIDESLVIKSPQWSALVRAAIENKIYVVPGFSHKENDALYMAQALISPDGTYLVRHKLRPSSGERGVWSDGAATDLKVIATPYGRWGILECWEHFHPAMTFNTQSQTETLHIASWPYTPDEAEESAAYWESLEVNLAAARVYAVNAQAPLVFASVGNARFLDNEGLDLNVVQASVPFTQQPLLYQSFNTTGLASTEPYTVDGEQSWGVLREMLSGFPSYIPKLVGSFTDRKIFSVSRLLTLANSARP
ncbi:aliphatic nitrilase-like protein [Boeremia exigua]|uniref:aliphatic nitrilase-like protein n=1 Tax=Boeremia exigua TaxID=749465 RepID=UPI001E8DDBA5|nr:aliphatic nitrilase-like protein [Boeremia exigua]KAH6625547.1 aliphatic nitrilase-like protein [Boeremia exigua]